MNRSRQLFFLLLMYCLPGFCQEYDYVNPDTTVVEKPESLNRDAEYAEHVGLVLMHPKGSPEYLPIAPLYSPQSLQLIFEDLKDDYIEYRFTIERCDRNWHIKDTGLTDYYQSVRPMILNEYEFSRTTEVGFTRFELLLPRKDEKFLKSGNYLIHVFDTETNERKFTRRFALYDPLVTITGNAGRTDDPQFSNYRQQIRFEVFDGKGYIKDIGRLYPSIHKNNAWELCCNEFSPSFVADKTITFNRTDKCTFDGGNEYRMFNMIEYRSISNNIVRVDHSRAGASGIWLDNDEPRSFRRYATLEDRNGSQQHTGDFRKFDPLDLDYADVTFTLKTEDAMLGFEIYVFGQMSNFQLRPEFRMVYNAGKKAYETSVRLKQGRYDYAYVARSPYQDLPDEGLIEGSHFETENDYTILIYYSSPFSGYDELIGLEHINSRTKNQSFYKNN